VLIPGAAADDTVQLFFDTRDTRLDVTTPLRVGRWNWSNSFSVRDQTSTDPIEIVDSTGRRTTYGRTFQTAVEWSTGINLPGLFSGSWKVQPGIQIVNQTSAGPFMLRNQFTGGRFVQQGKRLQFSAGMSPTFFGFFPGLGPLSRIRHAVSPIVSYAFAPGARVSEQYARALDPTGRTRNARTDPVQTISLGLSQNIEAKLRPAPGDTSAQARKIRLLSINTSSVAYNFEIAKQPGRRGWQTQSLSNTLASDLLPGFDLRLEHSLWDGPVSDDTTRFDPFLSSVSASFSIRPSTLRGLAALFGLGRREPEAEPASPPPGPRDAADQSGIPPFPDRRGPYPRGVLGPAVAGTGFSLNVQFTSNRVRRDTTRLAGQRQMNLNMAFSPTRNWSASWSTSFDFETEQFGSHFLQFNRDLRRWQASFTFQKSPNGNFSFSFNISLRDQPDIKFDYDQQTFVQ
jgi:hypothetical protein